MFEYNTLAAFAKSFGLFYLIGLSVAALIYALRPANAKQFDKAAQSIIVDEDKPCQ